MYANEFFNRLSSFYFLPILAVGSLTMLLKFNLPFQCLNMMTTSQMINIHFVKTHKRTKIYKSLLNIFNLKKHKMRAHIVVSPMRLDTHYVMQKH